jgi:hypothetical protein
MTDLKRLIDQLHAADCLALQCPPRVLQFVPSTSPSEPRLGPSVCNTSMIMYLQMLSFLRDEAARPTPNTPLLACVQIAHFRLDVERRLELMNTFMRSAFESISAGS